MVAVARREPTATLVVSAWHEGMPSRVVARITYTLDVSHGDRVTRTAAGVDEIVAVVRGWLDDVAAQRPSGDATVTGE